VGNKVTQEKPLKSHGLYLGKFAPLHLGHEFMIDEALKVVDQLTVLIYEAPGLTEIPLAQRANWIRALNPEIEVIECDDGPTDVTYESSGMREHEMYVIDKLGERKITHFFSSEPYGEHMSAALNAEDIRIDQGRESIPISATLIREDPYAHRNFLSKNVYFDHLVKVVLLGAPSTGKSTLSAKLAEHFTTTHMPEYGREYWESNNIQRRLTLEQLLEIAITHREREIELAHTANRYFFVDTNAITTEIFSYYYHGDALPRLRELSNETSERYDLVILCGDDIPYDDTEDRSGETNRSEFQKATLDVLNSRGIKYHLVTGSIQERINQVSRILETMSKGKK
jgi:HTH-type transcriptional regulator, transcriptional repressor of NAD biosynthesis genes